MRAPDHPLERVIDFFGDCHEDAGPALNIEALVTGATIGAVMVRRRALKAKLQEKSDEPEDEAVIKKDRVCSRLKLIWGAAIGGSIGYSSLTGSIATIRLLINEDFLKRSGSRFWEDY